MEILVNGLADHDFIVFEDSFKNTKRLQDAIACSKDCVLLTSGLNLEYGSLFNVSKERQSKNACFDRKEDACETSLTRDRGTDGDIHECKPSDNFFTEEIGKLQGTENVARQLLKDTENAISGVQDTIAATRERKEENLVATRRAFDLLRKAIDNREKQLQQQIEAGAESKYEALKLQKEKLELLGTQVKNHINLVKQMGAKNMEMDQLYSSRVILEQRTKDLIIMKNTSSVEPVRKEQALIELSGVEQLSQEVSNLGHFQFSGSVEHAWKHTIPVDQFSLLTVTIRDVNDKCVAECAQELEAVVKTPTGKEIPTLIKEIGEGRYSVAFVPDMVGEHEVSLMVAGEPVPHSPYRYVHIITCCAPLIGTMNMFASSFNAMSKVFAHNFL